MKKILVALIGLSFSLQALAYGTVSEAKIVQVRIDRGGQGMVMFDRPVIGDPASCRNSAYANALAFDSNTAGGKAIMAMALAAKASGDPISVIGTGGCATYGGAHVEDWSYGVVY